MVYNWLRITKGKMVKAKEGGRTIIRIQQPMISIERRSGGGGDLNLSDVYLYLSLLGESTDRAPHVGFPSPTPSQGSLHRPLPDSS